MNQQEDHYRAIEAAMVQAQRQSWRAISPADILLLTGFDLTEKQMQQELDGLVDFGRLVKVGRGAARGYRLATAAQRHALAVKFGRVPRGDLSVSEHTEIVYQEIEKAVAKAYRDLGRGVLPRDIQSRLPWDRAEGSLRRDCLEMYMVGRLVRVSGHGARQGYRLPHLIEKMAFSINQGMWPYGTESVVTWA